MKKRIFSLLLAVVMLIGMFPVYPFASAASNSAATIYCDGKQVSNVTLPYGDAVHLEAKQSAAGSLQWQIQVNSNLWVDISNADSHSLRVSYGMVASLLKGNSAQMRCAVKNGSEVQYSEPVTVTVDYTEPETSEPVQEPVEVQVQVQETPVQQETVDETADEKAALTKAQENLAAAETAVKEAEAALANEQQLAESAAAAVADAEAAKAAADVKAAEAKAALGSAYDEAIAAAKTAEENLAAAKTAADEAAAAVPAAKEKATAAAAALAEAEAAKTAADAKVAEAEAALNLEAQAAYDAAVAAAKAAEENLAAAQAAAAAANEDETAETTETTVDTAAALAEAEAAKAAADAKVAEAQAALNPEAQAAYDAAVADAKTAEENLAAAKTAADEAAAAVTAAEEAVTNTAAALAEAETAKAAADAKVAEEKAALDPEAQAAYDAAVAAAKAAEEAVVTAKAEAELRQQAVADAQKNLEAANAAKADAEKAVADAEAALKDAQAAGSRVLKFAAVPRAAAEGETEQKYSILIQYLLDVDGNGSLDEVSKSWGAQVSPNLPLEQTIPMPKVAGYVPTVNDDDLPTGVTAVRNDPNSSNVLTHLHLSFDPTNNPLTGNIEIKVVYQPTTVNFLVKHYWQNATDDNYTLHEETTKTGVTKTQVPETVHENYPGLYHLTYERPLIAADGSTVVEIYYDRNYYLLSFDLDGGYGVEPVYARYGAPIEVQGTPVKAGYVHNYWVAVVNGVEDGRPTRIPAFMPAMNTVYKAIWDEEELAQVSVVIWGENANDDEYSYLETMTLQSKPGTEITFQTENVICGHEDHDHKTAGCTAACGYEEHVHSVELGCYKLICSEVPHNHDTDGCGYDCGKTEHSHSSECCTKASEIHNLGTSCYSGVGDRQSIVTGIPDNPVNGYVFEHWAYGNLIYIDGYYYRYTGTTSEGNTAPLICNSIHSHSDHTCTYCAKNLEPHTHTEECYDCDMVNNDHVHSLDAGCYKRDCDKTVHVHDDDCYKQSCGKINHSHTTDCYIQAPTKIESDLWVLNTEKSETVTVNPDGTTVMNVYYDRKEFTLTFKVNNTTVKTITDKWGADIHDQFPIKDNNGTIQWQVPNNCESMEPGTRFASLDSMPAENITFTYYTSDDAVTLHYYVEALPDEEIAYSHEGKNFKLYKEIDIQSGVYLTYTEEFHDILGFKQWWSDPAFDKHEQGGSTATVYSGDECVLCYTRNTFDIVYYNPTDLLKTEENVPYQMPLTNYDWEPTVDQAPALYAPGSVQFGGWYLNPDCSGERYDFNKHTMPAGPNNKDGETALALYAKWELVTHHVNFYLTEDDMNAGTSQIGTTVDVLHGNIMEETQIPANPVREPYNFEGWFYRNDKGEEKAFRPDLMAVNQDLNLYARWTSSKIVDYTIEYRVVQTDETGAPKKENGQWVWATNDSIAEPLTGMAMAGTSKTFDAVLPENATEKEGVFPLVASHTLTFDIEDTSKNTYTFPYVRMTSVPYTVRYVQILEDGTEKEVATTENKSSTYAIVTENYKPVDGLFPDAFQKSLILTVSEDGTPNTQKNVITFYYTDSPIYVVRHYVQRVSSHGFTTWEIAEESIIDGIVGETYSAKPIEIKGYDFSLDTTRAWNSAKKYPSAASGVDPGVATDEGTLPADVTVSDDGKVAGVLSEDGLYLNLYYLVGKYPYIVEFREKESNEELLNSVKGEEIYGKWVTNQHKTIEGFTLTNPGEGVTIKESLTGEDNKLVYYYTRDVGSLKISKTVQAEANGEPSNTLAPKDTEFVFTVKPRDINTIPESSQYSQYTCYVYDNDETTPVSTYTLSIGADKSLTPAIKLKANQYAVIEGLPTGAYIVQETEILGYVSDAYDGVEVEVTNSETPAELPVQNRYPIYTGDLIVEKVTDRAYANDVLPDTNFTFKATFVPDPAAMLVNRAVICKIYNAEGALRETETIQMTESETEQTYTKDITLKNGERAVFEGVPVGQYKVVELSNPHYETKCEVSRIVETDGKTVEQVLTTYLSQNGDVMGGFHNIEVDKTVKAKFTNTYTRHRGNLRLIKTVVEEYENDIWTDSKFTFTVSGKTPLEQGTYQILVGEEQKQLTIGTSGEFSFEVNINVSDDPNRLTQSGELLIQDLPISVGSIGVTENTTSFTSDNGNVTYVTEVEDATEGTGTRVQGWAPITGVEEPQQITFRNTVPRTTGNLKITKEVVEFAEGVNIDTNQEFTFEVQMNAAEGVLEGEFAYKITDKEGNELSADNLKVTDGKLRVNLKHEQSVLIQGLPVGNYTVTELAVDGYDSSFGDLTNKQDTVDPAVITTGNTTVLTCKNTYPVYFSNLIVQKNVVTPADFRDADKAPENAEFIYQVTISGYSDKINLEDGIAAKFYANADDQNPTTKMLQLTNGENGVKILTFQLKHGQKVDLNLPSCYYVIQETELTGSNDAVTAHYDVAYTVGTETGVSGNQYALAPGATQNVLFTNTWKRHTGSLTVSKTAENASGETFLFQITGPNGFSMTLPLQAGQSQTIYDLPLGDYTVKENTAWSWRFTADNASQTVTLTETDHSKTVAVTNTPDNGKWLNDVSVERNTFNPATTPSS